MVRTTDVINNGQQLAVDLAVGIGALPLGDGVQAEVVEDFRGVDDVARFEHPDVEHPVAVQFGGGVGAPDGVKAFGPE